MYSYNERTFIDIFKALGRSPKVIGSGSIPGLWFYGDIDLEADRVPTFSKLCNVLDKMKEKGIFLIEIKIEDDKGKKKFKPGEKITSNDLINANLLKIDGVFIDEGNRLTEISCNYGRSILPKPVKPLSWYKKLKRILSKIKRSDKYEDRALMSDIIIFLNETGDAFKDTTTAELLRTFDLHSLGVSKKVIEYNEKWYSSPKVDINKLAKEFIMKHNLEHLI